MFKLKLKHISKDFESFKINTFKYKNNSNNIKDNYTIINKDFLVVDSVKKKETQDVLYYNNISKENIQKEYYPSIFWAKCSGDLINYEFKKQINEVKDIKIFKNEDENYLNLVLKNYIMTIQHPVLCKNKEKDINKDINFVTKTSSNKPYNLYNNKEFEKVIPFKLEKLENKLQFYSSSKIFEVPLKSPKNGEIFVTKINEYIKKEYNLSDEWVEKVWSEYFKSLQLQNNEVIKMGEFIKNDYILKDVMLKIANNKLEKKEIKNDQWLDFNLVVKEFQGVKINKEEVIKRFRLNE